MKEFINTLTRMRYALLQRKAASRAPVEKNYEQAVYKQKKKQHAAKQRALSRQIDALTAGITLMEHTALAREVLRGKANVRAVNAITKKKKEESRYCSGCGELAPCQSDCPSGTYTIKLRSK